MKYLKTINTLEELKRAYYRLAIRLHPDRGGDVEEMKILNNEYDIWFKRVSHIHTNKEGKRYEKQTNEKPQEFKDIIDELMKMNGITIEVIGSFIWVGGVGIDDKEKHAVLKGMKFRWHKEKLCWYKSPAGYRKYNNKKYTMDEVRDMFGRRFYAETENTTQNPITV